MDVTGPEAAGIDDPGRADEGPTRRLEREEFERGHIAPGEAAAEPRPAATVILARPAGSADFEVLLLRRPDAARFAAGAYVFAGGAVDPGDSDAELVRRLEEVTGIMPDQRPALAAGLRELYEETGILLCDPATRPSPLDAGRAQLLSGEIGFAGFVRAHDLSFRELSVAYVARWVTPEPLSLRYDARFFLAADHSGEPPRLTDELESFLWLRPEAALESFRAGDLPMLFPTRKTLETLRGLGGLGEAMDHFRRREVRVTRPRLLVEEDGVQPLLPGDPGYRRAR